MQSLTIVFRLLRGSPLSSWLGILCYVFGRTLHDALGINLFTSRVIRLKELSFVADVRGMSGLVFMDQILFQGIYDYPPLLADRTIEVLFDVGANCGFYALSCCRRIETLRAFCFEPHPATFAKLNRNVAVNRLADRVVPVQAAAGAQAGECILKVSEESSMGVVAGSAVQLADTTGRLMPVTEVKVPLLTLDEFAAGRRTFPDLIKVDVEGFEVEVLKGATECLHYARYAVIECDTTESRRECETILRENSFQIEVRESLLFARKP